MGWSDDPVRDAMRRDMEVERWEARRPICFDCGEPIVTEECYEFDGDYICTECLKNHRKFTDDCLVDRIY